MRLARAVAVVVVAVVVPPVALAREISPSTSAIHRLHAAAGCDAKRSPWRPWCIADGFLAGAPAPLPAATTLVGFRIEIAPDADVGDALANKVTLAALAISADRKVDLVAIAPSSEAERQLTAETIPRLATVFLGEAKLAVLPPQFTAFVTKLKPTYAVTRSDRDWSWQGQRSTELLKVGAYWVAVELGPRAAPARGERHAPYPTVWITILTDAWK